MRKFLVYSISIIVLLALNMVFPIVRNSAPNFLLLFLVFYSFSKEDQDFLLIAFFAGLLLDIFSGASFGAYTMSFLIIGLLINYTTETFLTADISFELMSLIVGCSYILFVLIFYAINIVEFKLHAGPFILSGQYFSEKIWLDLALNLIFAIPVYYLTLLNKRLLQKRGGYA